MARRSSAVTQAAIAKLIKGALAAGIYKEHIIGVKLDRDGAATLLFGEPKKPASEQDVQANEWDEVLQK